MRPGNLAILGGKPAFSEPLMVGRPNIGDRRTFLTFVEQALDRRSLTNGGPLVEAFERSVADRLGVAHCVVLSNATVGLELAYTETGLTGEVIVPSFTFVATAHALRRVNCTPVFCDIDADTHCIDPRAVEALITPRTTGIVGVHLWGRPCQVDVLQRIADEHGLQLILDAAHAFGCTAGTRSIGTFGRCEVFSFHATKVLNAFEGGAVTTEDASLAARLRLARNFGLERHDHVVSVGTNAKMPEVSAAMGLVNLDAFDEFVATNRRNYMAYREPLAALPGVRVLPFPEHDHPNFQYVVIEIDQAEAGLSRDTLMTVLHAENIMARRYFWPGVHRMAPYRSSRPGAERLPVTELVASRVLVLPTGTTVDREAIATVCDVISSTLADPGRVEKSAATRSTSLFAGEGVI